MKLKLDLTIRDAGRKPPRFPDDGITLVGQLEHTSTIIEIHNRLGIQAGGR
jgi:hypothetical protein